MTSKQLVLTGDFLVDMLEQINCMEGFERWHGRISAGRRNDNGEKIF